MVLDQISNRNHKKKAPIVLTMKDMLAVDFEKEKQNKQFMDLGFESLRARVNGWTLSINS